MWSANTQDGQIWRGDVCIVPDINKLRSDENVYMGAFPEEVVSNILAFAKPDDLPSLEEMRKQIFKDKKAPFMHREKLLACVRSMCFLFSKVAQK